MFNSFLDSNNKLLVNRLARAQARILALSLSTREEYLAQVTSLINKVINTGYAMQELVTIASQTPGIVGDPITNLIRLNEDATDVTAEIGRLEDNASALFNLAAASRNSICQQIREAIYASSATLFTEQFINKDKIDSASSATIDMSSGVALLPFSSEKVLTPSFAVGQNSVGSTEDSITALESPTTETLFRWNGALLEIIISFDAPTIVNRLLIQPDTYVGYEITTFTASADGSLFEDILSDLGETEVVLDASAGKYSGATVLDFPPRSVQKIRMVIENMVSQGAIGLRSLTFSQRTYQATGQVISAPQTLPTGSVKFSEDADVFDPYVSVTHQISSDSVHYTTIQPGLVTLPAKWWYRALLNRSSKAFRNDNTGVAANTADPAFSTGFTLLSSSSIPLDPTTIERTLVFTGISSAIPLAETPLPGTLQVSQGTLLLNSSQFNLDTSRNLTISNPTGTITVTYQTSAQGAQGVAALENYYTPVLRSVEFRA